MANNESNKDIRTTEVMEENASEEKENKDYNTGEEENSPTELFFAKSDVLQRKRR